jgi:hypothetical protein
VGYDAGGCDGELDIRCHGISVRIVSGGDTGYGRREEGRRDTSRSWRERKGTND